MFDFAKKNNGVLRKRTSPQPIIFDTILKIMTTEWDILGSFILTTADYRLSTVYYHKSQRLNVQKQIN